MNHAVDDHLIFFVEAPATTRIYPLSLHDALPICDVSVSGAAGPIEYTIALRNDASRSGAGGPTTIRRGDGSLFEAREEDRKSTRLNSSHVEISYAVFCLKKKTQDKVVR